MNNLNKTKNRGFTIIETMISISLFLIVITVGMGSLLNANLVHRKSTDMRSIMDGLSFILEDMSRNMRTGYDFQCFNEGETIKVGSPKSCESGSIIVFEPADGNPDSADDQWVYVFSKENGKGIISKSTKGPNDNQNFVQLTTSDIDININRSGFSVLGAESPDNGDEQQPLINIRISGSINLPNGESTPFNLSTSVSQRKIDASVPPTEPI